MRRQSQRQRERLLRSRNQPTSIGVMNPADQRAFHPPNPPQHPGVLPHGNHQAHHQGVPFQPQLIIDLSNEVWNNVRHNVLLSEYNHMLQSKCK